MLVVNRLTPVYNSPTISRSCGISGSFSMACSHRYQFIKSQISCLKCSRKPSKKKEGRAHNHNWTTIGQSRKKVCVPKNHLSVFVCPKWEQPQIEERIVSTSLGLNLFHGWCHTRWDLCKLPNRGAPFDWISTHNFNIDVISSSTQLAHSSQ